MNPIPVSTTRPLPIAQLIGLLLVAFALSSPAQVSTNATNSTVRFRITHGANLLGDIDVELFDQLKPVTVSNFLTYAQSGRYADSILHRVIPQFILEGGGYTIPTPFANSPMLVVNSVPEYPTITNEVNVGGLQSNVLGTLAMSKTTSNPNSATSRWFFNLGDNSRGTGITNLNTANGGYTVFGRVIAGLSVLQQFNARQPGNGIVDTTTLRYREVCGSLLPFPTLPVSFFGGLGCVNYSDAYTVDIILLNAPDVLRPTVTITSPTANTSLTQADVTVRGWVKDNVGVSNVRVRRGTNDPVTATVTGTNWTATLTNVPPGTNSIVAEAIDTSGLRGQSIVSFFRSVRVPLTLAVIGHGSIRGAVDQQLLEIGRGYNITAKPDPGNLFAGWSGDGTGDKLTLNFLMDSNRTINAVFATNLFPYVKGIYTGLFHNSDQVEQASSGFVTLSLANAGTYSAKFQMNGRSYSMKGTFSPDGRETNLVTRAGTNSLLVTLAVDLNGGSDQLTGTVTNNQVTAINTNAAWSATLLADRATFKAPSNLAPQAGRYTLLVPPDEASPTAPPADGYGSVNVQPTGKLAFVGALPDGTPVTQGTTLSKFGTWPFYAFTSRDGGALISWLTITNDPATNVSGLMNWFKPARRGLRYYAAGFTNETTVTGARFLPGNPTNRVFGLTNAVVGFTNGNLAADFDHGVTFDANGKATNLGTNQLTLTISKSTGLFNGSVKPPGSTRAVPFKGVVLQGQRRGAGFFLGTNSTGSVKIGE